MFEDHWLKKARIDAGARNAAATLGGYVGIAVAVLIALSTAGFDMSNLALVAGALSVGIGFGLQNIVNNFVSGLILLFERPIRKGDWIVVGSTEGYVQSISTRSTQIRTFDRAEVIVPNSELIAKQVTNWTLRDLKGRVRVPVGVAYGSEPTKVAKVLLDIAQKLPGIVQDGSLPKPKAVFLGFGETALNFELRFFIRNVDDRIDTLSAANFAIDAAFRAEGIEFPAPIREARAAPPPPPTRDPPN
jgi:small-conductance mechanosensitive channel